jgi:hypothetical protein
MKEKFNIFTCCNNRYNQFIPIFIFSHLYHNEESFVEIGYEGTLDKETQKGIKYLNVVYPNRFLVREVAVGKMKHNGKIITTCPNLTRFIVEPQVKSEYIYISDIDIICLQEGILQIHIDVMKKTGLPYSNIVREKHSPKQTHRRLTGLHFSPWANYFPLPDLQDLVKNNLQQHDEVFLYEMVKKKYPVFDYENKFRPVHGIHVSMNREPSGWGITSLRKKKWNNFRSTLEFLELENLQNAFIKEKLNQIDEYTVS